MRGYGFSAKLLKNAGGKLCVKIALAACLLITMQDVLGVVVAKFIGMHPLLGLAVLLLRHVRRRWHRLRLRPHLRQAGCPRKTPLRWAWPPAPWATS